MREAYVRAALRAHLIASSPDVQEAFDELWVPRSNARADIAVIGACMDGFEIKTERDTLRRLPRQVVAYGGLFDRCTAVVAERHEAAVREILPMWWGITVIDTTDEDPRFESVRDAATNPSLDPEILVRLLWRAEVQDALRSLGAEPDAAATRSMLWDELLALASLQQLRRAVRHALVNRDRGQAQIFRRTPTPAVVPGR